MMKLNNNSSYSNSNSNSNSNDIINSSDIKNSINPNIDSAKSFVSRKIDYSIEDLIEVLDEKGDFVDSELDKRIEKIEVILPLPKEKYQELNILKGKINSTFSELRLSINSRLDLLDKQIGMELMAIDTKVKNLEDEIEKVLFRFEDKLFDLSKNLEKEIDKWGDLFVQAMDKIVNKSVDKSNSMKFHLIAKDGVVRNFELVKGGIIEQKIQRDFGIK